MFLPREYLQFIISEAYRKSQKCFCCNIEKQNGHCCLSPWSLLAASLGMCFLYSHTFFSLNLVGVWNPVLPFLAPSFFFRLFFS